MNDLVENKVIAMTATAHVPNKLVLPAIEAHELRTIRFPSRRPTVDLDRIERAVREILLAIGENPDRDGLLDTPARVARAYRDLFAGLRQDPAAPPGSVFEEATEGDVVVRGIEFFSVCEHHLLPFFGQAHVAYRPTGGRVVGLSKLARTVEVFARRPQVQERLTGQVAGALMRHLRPAGVLVVVEAQHMCMAMRGVGKTGSMTLTTAARGVFETDAAARNEILRLLGRS
jgi:GTP cyclohydrolase I